ncbi:hypothetical protein OHC33_006586 [Knufia fluminis]|uniref:Uncharacterized protein n=1 Tax=Knufia fluminis TaxID=191047 RepID=A0AAN8F6Z8_9EURO|nr:hypothetical protein OHC33_006586 [Knufia fluminis]
MMYPSELKGIHKIPNEILIKILAFVPYVPKGIGTLSHLTAPAAKGHDSGPPPDISQSHTPLGQVSTRFRNIIASSAIPREIIKNQFPELAVFRDLTEITPQDLESFSKLYSRIVNTINKVLKDDDSKEAKQAMTMGVFMLERMTAFGIPDSDTRSNACLVAMARKDLWSDKWLMTLRYTIRRICDHLYPTSTDVCSLIRRWGGSHPDIPEEMEIVAQMFKRRSFEKALLMNNHQQYVSKIIDDGVCVKTQILFIMAYVRFSKQMSHVVSAGDEPLDFAGQQEHEAMVRYVRGKQWRILTCASPKEDDLSKKLEKLFDSEMWKEFSNEIMVDEFTRKVFEDGNVSTDGIPTIRDLKEEENSCPKPTAVSSGETCP